MPVCAVGEGLLLLQCYLDRNGFAVVTLCSISRVGQSFVRDGSIRGCRAALCYEYVPGKRLALPSWSGTASVFA